MEREQIINEMTDFDLVNVLYGLINKGVLCKDAEEANKLAKEVVETLGRENIKNILIKNNTVLD